jgi:MoaA/NifB/PqqE/SkfB family radical SAM enzyme
MNKVYCPVPWTEVHINADGTYHSCGAQPNIVSGTLGGTMHNVHNMTIREWMNSSHQITARAEKINNVPTQLCNMCYQEDSVGKSSKRKRELDKGFPVFTLTTVDQLPVSYHMSLGNECNLSCRMCAPVFSSKIAAEQKRLGEWAGPVKQNWTENPVAWHMVQDTITATKNLQAIHIIGGEPLLNPRFEQLIDNLIANDKTDIYFGFTTNGTIINNDLIKKLQAFRHVDIGISVESAGKLNNFVRNGAETAQILANIDRYLAYRKPGQVYVTLRIVPSALSVHTIDELFHWCIERKLDIMSNILSTPTHMAITQLPKGIKLRLIEKLSSWQTSETTVSNNDRNPNDYKQHMDKEIAAIIKLLHQPNDPELTDRLYKQLDAWGWFNDEDIRNYFFIAEQHNY